MCQDPTACLQVDVEGGITLSKKAITALGAGLLKKYSGRGMESGGDLCRCPESYRMA